MCLLGCAGTSWFSPWLFIVILPRTSLLCCCHVGLSGRRSRPMASHVECGSHGLDMAQLTRVNKLYLFSTFAIFAFLPLRNPRYRPATITNSVVLGSNAHMGKLPAHAPGYVLNVLAWPCRNVTFWRIDDVIRLWCLEASLLTKLCCTSCCRAVVRSAQMLCIAGQRLRLSERAIGHALVVAINSNSNFNVMNFSEKAPLGPALVYIGARTCASIQSTQAAESLAIDLCLLCGPAQRRKNFNVGDRCDFRHFATLDTGRQQSRILLCLAQMPTWVSCLHTRPDMF